MWKIDEKVCRGRIGVWCRVDIGDFPRLRMVCLYTYFQVFVFPEPFYSIRQFIIYEWGIF